jgi:Kef-type K+ transport system membrane component KefB
MQRYYLVAFIEASILCFTEFIYTITMIGDNGSFFVSAFQPTPQFAARSLIGKQHISSYGNVYRSRSRRKTVHHAMPSPDDLGLHSATIPSVLHSVGDFMHATTSHAQEAASHLQNSLLLSDSSAAPHLSFNDVLREVEEEVVAEFKSEFSQNEHAQITPEMEEIALNDVGHDLIIFLTISVIVAPLSTALGISPVLLYLLFGLVCGPHGLQLLRGNEEVGFELGDFGILFLLFVEGLNLSPERLRELGSFFSLGATQLLFSVGVIFFGLFLGGPLLFQVVSNPNVPIDPLIVQLLEQPVVAFAIAAAGALSSSAFVLPILKEKGWEDRPDGVAALTILLLQDLAVAPLLVILPLVADLEGVGVTAGDSGGADPIQLGMLAFKATVGFGAVLALASVALRKVFQIVASSRSSQSFVAASLLVAVGMGVISDALGLSSTTGAFAAGVLLAESGYRAQIEVKCSWCIICQT